MLRPSDGTKTGCSFSSPLLSCPSVYICFLSVHFGGHRGVPLKPGVNVTGDPWKTHLRLFLIVIETARLNVNFKRRGEKKSVYEERRHADVFSLQMPKKRSLLISVGHSVLNQNPLNS